MERWTIQALRETDDFSFAICLLNERANKLNIHAPLCVKIRQAVDTLSRARQICAENDQEGRK